MPTPRATGRAAYWVEPVASTTTWPALPVVLDGDPRGRARSRGATCSRYQMSHFAIISASESPRRSRGEPA